METFPQVLGKARDKAGEALGVSGKLVEEAQSIKEEAKERKGAKSHFAHVSRTIGEDEKGRASDKAGKLLGVSGDLVAGAQKIKEESPGEFEKILKGEKTVSEIKSKRRALK